MSATIVNTLHFYPRFNKKTSKTNFFTKIPTNFRKVCPEEKKHPNIYVSIHVTGVWRVYRNTNLTSNLRSLSFSFFFIPFFFSFPSLQTEKQFRKRTCDLTQDDWSPAV